VTLFVRTQICQDLSGVLDIHLAYSIDYLLIGKYLVLAIYSVSLLDNFVRKGYSVLIILLVSYK